MSEKLSLEVTGMTCAACVGRVERALKGAAGVESASVNLATEQAAVSYDPAQTNAGALAAVIEEAGYGTAQQELSFGIMGMTCAACVGRVERALKGVPGVLEASVNLATERATVAYLPGSVGAEQLHRAVEEAGYGVQRPENLEDSENPESIGAAGTHRSPQEAAEARLRRDLLTSAAFAVPLFLLSMGPMLYPPLHHWLLGSLGEPALNLAILALTLPVQFGPGRRFYRAGWAALRHGSPDMNTLVMIGTSAAFLYSAVVTLWPALLPPAARHVYFEASGVVITLVLLGKYLESRAKGRSGEAMRALLALRPAEARVLEGDTVRLMPPEQVRRGQRVQVRGGESIPVDGVVLGGRSYVDESMLTGESRPILKEAGDEVTGGTLNGEGLLTIEATRVGADSALAQIMSLVERAQAEKPPIQGLADRVVAGFVPAVLGIAALTALAWLLLGGAEAVPQALVHAVAVLIIACPCAMGLATPVSVMVGSGRAAELGVLFGGGPALENLHRADVVALDKTGTLTAGQPALTAIYTDGLDEAEVLRLAASAESGSAHPIAHALTEAAAGRRIPLPRPEEVDTVAGFGLSAQVEGRRVELGAERYMRRLGLDTGPWQERLAEMGHQAATPVFAAVDGRICALLGVSDPLKAGSVEAVSELHRQGYRVMMLTGDSWATAKAAAKEVGLDPAREVQAEVLPADKAAAVAALQAQGLRVAMVGDGVNDAPALSRADVGIALGTGTDVAAQTADVLLLSGDLRGAATATALSRAVLQNIQLNLLWAFGYNILLIPVAAGVFARWGLSLSPVLAAAAMGLSSVLVMTNALSLKRFQPPRML